MAKRATKILTTTFITVLVIAILLSIFAPDPELRAIARNAIWSKSTQDGIKIKLIAAAIILPIVYFWIKFESRPNFKV